MINLERRVKIYKLIENLWEDQGTGLCKCIPYDEHTNKLMFVVYSEEDSKVILSSKITHRALYQKEQGTLLIWTENPDGPNICLSFQAEEGRDEAYHCIIEAQPFLNLPTPPPTQRDESPPPQQPSLPQPTHENLGLIMRELDNVIRNSCPRDPIFVQMQQNKFFTGLASVYKAASEHSQINTLYSLNRIVKSLLTIGDSRVIDALVSDEMVLIIAGILEKDPELPDVYLGYRDYLEDSTRFRQVLEIPEENIRRKVHESFRLSYFKETILSRTTDEMLINRFATAITQRNTEIFYYLTSQVEYLTRVFALLDDPESPTSVKRDVILFTHHLCSLFKTVGAHAVLPLLRIISQRGLFLIFRALLLDEDIKVRSMGMEIVMLVVDQDPINVRNYIRMQLQNNTSPSFISLLIQSLVTESSSSVSSQYADLIRSLLFGQNQMLPKMGVPSTMLMPDVIGAGLRRRCPDQEYLSIHFYDHFIEPLCAPILSIDAKSALTESGEPGTLDITKKQEIVCTTICELLISCLRYQTARIKHFLITSDIVPKIGLFLRSRWNQMRLTALRFIRVMIGTKEEDFQRLLIKHKLLPEIFNFYLSSDSANNLLNSAGLEFFDFISRNNMVLLINSLVDNLGQEITLVKGTKVFSHIHQQYIAAQEGTAETTEAYSPNRSSTTVPNSPARVHNRGWHSSTLDNDEEKYFGYDEDEEPNALSPTVPVLNGHHPSDELPGRPKSLVDYDEEDDDALLALSKDAKNVPTIKKKTKLFSPVIKPKTNLERSESFLTLDHLKPESESSSMSISDSSSDSDNTDGVESDGLNPESGSDILQADAYLKQFKLKSPHSGDSSSPDSASSNDASQNRKRPFGLDDHRPVVSSLSLQEELEADCSISDEDDGSGPLSPPLRLESPEFTDNQKEKILHYEEQESQVPVEIENVSPIRTIPSNGDTSLHTKSDEKTAVNGSSSELTPSEADPPPEKRLKLSDPQDPKDSNRLRTASPDPLSLPPNSRSSPITEP